MCDLGVRCLHIPAVGLAEETDNGRRGPITLSSTSATAHTSSGPPSPCARPGPPDPPRLVGKVHTGNGITRYEQDAYGLVGGVAEGFCAPVELRGTEREPSECTS